jgi:hypothetical protein
LQEEETGSYKEIRINKGKVTKEEDKERKQRM